MGATNEHHTPYWGVVLFLAVSALVTAAAGAHDQELVLVYAVSVFMSFLVGLLAMARFSYQRRTLRRLLAERRRRRGRDLHPRVNIARGRPLASVVSALVVAAAFYQLWARVGRPEASPKPSTTTATDASGSPPSTLC